MDLLPTFEQRSLAASVRDAIAVPDDVEAVWSSLCRDLGVAGIGVVEEAGGVGGTLADLAVVFHELGHGVAADPVLGQVAGARLLAAAGDEGAKTASAAMAGEVRLAATLPTLERAHVAVASGAATGRVDGVVGHRDADLLVLLVDAAGDPDQQPLLLTVEADAPGLTVTPLDDLDLRRTTLRVELEHTPVEALSASTAAAEPAIALMVAALQLGGSARCVDDAVSYAKSRYQFGRPIGSFQAIKHRLADLHHRVDSASIALRRAVDLVDDRHADARALTALVQIAASEAYVDAAHTSLQVHGGIGFTVETDCHLHVRRAHATSHLLGRPEVHRARLAELLLGSSGESC